MIEKGQHDDAVTPSYESDPSLFPSLRFIHRLRAKRLPSVKEDPPLIKKQFPLRRPLHSRPVRDRRAIIFGSPEIRGISVK